MGRLLFLFDVLRPDLPDLAPVLVRFAAIKILVGAGQSRREQSRLGWRLLIEYAPLGFVRESQPAEDRKNS